MIIGGKVGGTEEGKKPATNSGPGKGKNVGTVRKGAGRFGILARVAVKTEHRAGKKGVL